MASGSPKPRRFSMNPENELKVEVDALRMQLNSKTDAITILNSQLQKTQEDLSRARVSLEEMGGVMAQLNATRKQLEREVGGFDHMRLHVASQLNDLRTHVLAKVHGTAGTGPTASIGSSAHANDAVKRGAGAPMTAGMCTATDGLCFMCSCTFEVFG